VSRMLAPVRHRLMQIKAQACEDRSDEGDVLPCGTGAKDLAWSHGWGVVRCVHEKLEFVAFFEAREDSEAAAAASGGRLPSVLVDLQGQSGFAAGERERRVTRHGGTAIKMCRRT
jgi:hypothetical protein